MNKWWQNLNFLGELSQLIAGERLFNVVHFWDMTQLTIFIYFYNDGIQFLSGWILTQHPHDGTQLLGADITATVGVEHVEGSLELFDLRLKKGQNK